jgi:hypothetical protein
VRLFYSVMFVTILLICVSCTNRGLMTPQARPYEVIGSVGLNPANGRTAQLWYIVSESSSFEEHAHTLARAATDLHREHRLDLTQLALYPNELLAGSQVLYGYGFYAADGRAGQGLSGADPDYRATWSLFAAEKMLTPEELAIAELWVERAPEFPSQEVLSSLSINEDALREQISGQLGLPLEEVRLPDTKLKLWRRIEE